MTTAVFAGEEGTGLGPEPEPMEVWATEPEPEPTHEVWNTEPEPEPMAPPSPTRSAAAVEERHQLRPTMGAAQRLRQNRR